MKLDEEKAEKAIQYTICFYTILKEKESSATDIEELKKCETQIKQQFPNLQLPFNTEQRIAQLENIVEQSLRENGIRMLDMVTRIRTYSPISVIKRYSAILYEIEEFCFKYAGVDLPL
ncbi:MAG: hypothetical protein ACMXYG_07250 [Candidatus Woesearchaeota archaeon]